MSEVKVVILGAGSYVFGPSALAGAILEHHLAGAELALVDVDRRVLDLMAGVGRRMANQTGVATRITTHTDRADALDGADFVLCSAAPGLQQRYRTDCRIIDTHAPGHVVTEFGGVQGISYSLRQIAFIEDVCAEMRRLAPGAWLFDVANPLPRLCQAAHEFGVPTAGFCMASLGGYAWLWRLLRGEPLEYPFAAARDVFDVTMAGLNHFSWIVEARDRADGADLLPRVRERLAGGASSGQLQTDELARQTGYLPTAGDRHIRDFLPPWGDPGRRQDPWHGNEAERKRRLALLRQVGDGTVPWDELLAHGSWEKPMDVVAAMAGGTPAALLSLNLVNDGQVPNLPGGVFVDTPATVSSGGPTPHTVPLPETVRPLCERAARVTDTIVRAARRRSARLVHEAVELDPTIGDKRAGVAAIEACLAAHADVLPAYS